MSKLFKKNSQKRISGKKYQIESLEPRFLMDASSGYSVDDWNKELDCIVDTPFWLTNDESVNDLVIDGLFVVNKDTAVTERAVVRDLLDCDKASETDFGIFSLLRHPSLLRFLRCC